MLAWSDACSVGRALEEINFRGQRCSKPGGVWAPPTCVAGAEVAPTGPGSSPGCARARLCAGGWLTSRRAERRGGGGEREREQVNGRAPSGSGSRNPGRVWRRCARRRPGRGRARSSPGCRRRPPGLAPGGGGARGACPRGWEPAPPPSPRRERPPALAVAGGSWPLHAPEADAFHGLRTRARDDGVTATPTERGWSLSSFHRALPASISPSTWPGPRGQRSAPPCSHALQ